MDKEFLNNLFLWLAEQHMKDVGGQFGHWNEREIFSDTEKDEYGCPKFLGVEELPIEELYEIVDNPVGDKQEYNDLFLEETPDEYKFITYEYVDQQVNGGYSGDDYAGYIYYPLPDGKFMKVYYNC